MSIGQSMNFARAGTPGTGVTAIESGNGNHRRTELIVAATHIVVTTPDTAALSQGALIYTFPAGQIIVHRVYGDVGLEINDATNITDTPEIGCGTAAATGANATLGDTANAENLWGPHVVAGCDTGADATDAFQGVTSPEFIMADAGLHTMYLSAADTWANGAGTANVVLENDARFVIDWTVLPLGGT